MMEKTLWISWERHRRSQNISAQLKVPLSELVSTKRGAIRYLELILCTWRLLRQTRPRVLIVQNPSMVLTAFSLLWKPWFQYKLIIDAHNEAVRPYIHNIPPVRAFARLSARLADCVIVTNNSLAHLIKAYGGRSFVLPDPIPLVPAVLPVRTLTGPMNFTVIATYAPDEPIATVLQVAAEYGDRIRLYLTGNPENAKAFGINVLPANAEFTGYLSDDDYWAQLAASDAVVDITAMPDCLVCGAYEAVAVEVPMLLTDDSATRELFSKGAVYATVEIDTIRKGFDAVLANLLQLKHEAHELKQQLQNSWQIKRDELSRLIEQL